MSQLNNQSRNVVLLEGLQNKNLFNVKKFKAWTFFHHQVQVSNAWAVMDSIYKYTLSLYFHFNIHHLKRRSQSWLNFLASWDFRLRVHLMCPRSRLMQQEPVRCVKHVYGNLWKWMFASYFHSDDCEMSQGEGFPPRPPPHWPSDKKILRPAFDTSIHQEEGSRFYLWIGIHRHL